ncbi:MAG TPA: septum formation initiator family protein [Anaeromyxobacteraceae bacterium]|nr:septum formation initiator family protein [Anaeromyxobacteraceae bacterium]
MSSTRQRKTWWLLFVGLVAFGVAAAFDPEGLRKHERLRGDVARLAAENAQLAAQNARLAAEARALRSDPEARERAAREELRFVRAGEIVYRLDAQPGATP